MKRINFLFIVLFVLGFATKAQLNDSLVQEINHSLIKSIGASAIIVTDLQMNANTMYNQGLKLNNDSKFDSAITFFKQAIEIDSTGNCGAGLNGSAYTEIGYAYSRSKKYDSAYYFLDQSIRINPTLPKSYINKSMILLSQKKYKESILVLDLLLQKREDFYVAYALRGVLNKLNADNIAAKRDFVTYLEKVGQVKNDEKALRCATYVTNVMNGM